MKFRVWLFRSSLALGALLAIAAVAGWFMLPDDFEATEAWTVLRRNNLELATQIKDAVVQSDQDVPKVGKKRGLPLIKIKLSRKDIAHFFDLYKKYENPKFGVAYYSKHNAWRKADLTYEGRTYEVKIKSHGRSPTNHRSGQYISLSVKMPRGESIQNSRRFSLLVRDHFVSKKQVVFDVADHFGVYKNQEELVRVQVNGWDEKIFYFDRRLNDAFMEVEGRPSLRLFGYGISDTATNKSSIYTGGDFDESEFRMRFAQTLVELEYPPSQHKALTDRFVAFNKALHEQRYEDLGEFCDLDYVSSFQAVRLITSLIGHIARVDNLYVFYDTANGKFYPVITRDSWMEKMQLLRGGSAELYVDTAGPWEQPLFRMISRNLDVRRRTYRKILDYIEEYGDGVGTRHRRLKERYDKLSYFGWANVGMRNAGWLKDDFTVHNLAAIKYYIDTPQPKLKISVDTDKVILSFAPRSMAGVQLKYFTIPADQRLPPTKVPVSVWGEIETNKKRVPIPVRQTIVRTAGGKIDLTPVMADYDFITPLTAESQQAARLYSIVVQLDTDTIRTAQGNVDLLLSNSMTGDQIKEFEADAQFTEFSVDQFPKVPVTMEKGSWLDAYPNLQTRLDADSVTIQSGDYSLNKDLILPKNLKLTIERGTTIRLGPNVAICGYNGLDVQGTREQPVVIRPIRPSEPFGSVGILGDANTVSNIQHLKIGGGYERWVNGVYFSGALSLHYNGTVNLHGCTFANNLADDGLNVKYGKVSIEDCDFRDNAADQVDLDLCTGTVEDCRFSIDNRRDANGDGLDVSGSQIIVRGCSFRGFPDKGMSVGEQSNIQCRDNNFRSNTTGVAVKDSSHAFLVDNQFEQNQVDVDAFQKKTMFSGGTVWLSKTPSSPLKIFLDPKSKAYTATSLTAFAEQANNAVPKLPQHAETSDAAWQPLQATMLDEPTWRLEPETSTEGTSAATEATSP